MVKRTLLSLFMIIALILFITPVSLAIEGITPSEFQSEIRINSSLAGDLKGFIGIVQIVGIGIVAIACVLMGIRYVMSSVEDKATIKKKLTPYVIGAAIFFCATGIVQVISEVAKWFIVAE